MRQSLIELCRWCSERDAASGQLRGELGAFGKNEAKREAATRGLEESSAAYIRDRVHALPLRTAFRKPEESRDGSVNRPRSGIFSGDVDSLRFAVQSEFDGCHGDLPRWMPLKRRHLVSSCCSDRMLVNEVSRLLGAYEDGVFAATCTALPGCQITAPTPFRPLIEHPRVRALWVSANYVLRRARTAAPSNISRPPTHVNKVAGSGTA